MMTPKEMFDQALKTSLRDPYDNLVSFSIDTNDEDEKVTILHLHTNLLRDEALFEALLTTLRAQLLTHSLHVSLQPHDDYSVDERFARLQGTVQDLPEIQITQIPYQENHQEDDQENDQENKSSWKKKAFMIGAGAVAAPFVVTGGAALLGFTSAGIAAGSLATGIMSSYGGSVAAGSFCAVMQSIGAAGLSASGTALASTVGATFVGATAKVFSFFSGRKSNDEKGDKSEKKRDNDDEEEKTQSESENHKNNDDEEKARLNGENSKSNDEEEEKILSKSDDEEEKISEAQSYSK